LRHEFEHFSIGITRVQSKPYVSNKTFAAEFQAVQINRKVGIYNRESEKLPKIMTDLSHGTVDGRKCYVYSQFSKLRQNMRDI